MRNILLATDGSEGASRATDIAIELAVALGGTLSIITVATQEGLSAEEKRELIRADNTISDALEALSNEVLWGVEEKARVAGLTDLRFYSFCGDPSNTIIESAQREQVDAIVMGRRGRGRLAGLLLGSVSQKVSSISSCVVIIVP